MITDNMLCRVLPLLRAVLAVFFASAVWCAAGQTVVVKECAQKRFLKSVPAGDYSGITWLGGDRYGVVSDKGDKDGVWIMRISTDSVTGEITSVNAERFIPTDMSRGDCEGVAFTGHGFMVAREAASQIVAFDTVGQVTAKVTMSPEKLWAGTANGGLESLAYDAEKHVVWTANEAPLPADIAAGADDVVRLVALDDSLRLVGHYAYRLDKKRKSSEGAAYAWGVSEIVAAGGGRLLVMERDFYVPRLKVGASVRCRLYEVCPDDGKRISSDKALTDGFEPLPKRLVWENKTRLGLLARSLANYEGACLGPRLADGSRVLVMVSDSQGQYAGVLRDWFKTVVVKTSAD